MSTKIHEIRSRIAELIGARKTAADELARIRARIAEAQSEIEALNSAALCRADMEEATRKDIQFIKENIAKTTGVRETILHRATNAVPVSCLVRGDGPSDTYDLLREFRPASDALYLIFDVDQIMNALRPVFDAVDWPIAGPRLATRISKRRTTEAEIEQLRAAEAELISSLASVTLPDPTVQTSTPQGRKIEWS